MGSLFSGVSGLSAHQQMLDVIGNNLANANTVGYKGQRIQFSDVFLRTISNGTQIGAGVQVASVDTLTAQGDIQASGRDLDLALQGGGFFTVKGAGVTLFSRAGSFGIDKDNYLVDPATGYRVQRNGTVGDPGPTATGFQTAGNNDIQVPLGSPIPGRASSSVTFQGNLSAAASGPQAQVLTSDTPFLTGGVAATAATLLNSLDGLQSAYAAGDTLLLQGQTPAGTTVNSTFNVTAATTLGDLVTAINGAFAGTTASINAAGNLVVQGSSTGPSSLSLNVNDSVGNTGGFNWGNHGMTVSTAGKDGDTVEAAIAVFDAQGNARNVSLTFQKQSSNVWNMTAQLNAADGVLQSSSAVGITFNTDGSYRVVSGGVPQITALFTGQTAAQTINLDFGTSGKFDGLTQVGGGSSAAATGQDGYGAGVLSGIAVNLDGTLMGNFSNGKSLALAQLAIASFANPGALTRYGSNYYAASEASGPSQLGVAGSGARGSIEQGALEGSNVNISAEFTRLIVAQNGYQVNAKTITVTNQVLQDLANIIR